MIKKKLPQQYWEFAEVFSKKASDQLSLHKNKVNHNIILEEVNMSQSPYNKYDSITLWYNIIVWQYNTITLLFKYDDSASNTLTLSENSLQGGSEICSLSDQSWTMMKNIWLSYMHIYWAHYDYIVYNTLFTLL